MNATITPAKATDAQLAYLFSLADKLGIDKTSLPLQKALVSLQIDDFKSQVAAQVAAAKKVQSVKDLTPGMYQEGTRVYRVQKAKSTGKLYAKLLTITPAGLDENGEPKYTASFDYAPGAIYKLTSANKMSDFQATEIGHNFGICCVCATVLTDPKSIDAGIGPVCGGKV